MGYFESEKGIKKMKEKIFSRNRGPTFIKLNPA